MRLITVVSVAFLRQSLSFFVMLAAGLRVVPPLSATGVDNEANVRRFRIWGFVVVRRPAEQPVSVTLQRPLLFTRVDFCCRLQQQ